MCKLRPMGAYKPHFASMPEDYYPTSICDMVLLVLLLVLTIGGSFGALVGFLVWDFQIGTSTFVLIWSIILVVFLVVMFVSIYFGGKSKLRFEKELIRQKVQQLKDQAVPEQSSSPQSLL